MAFPIVTALGAAAGIGGSILGGIGQRQAAAAQNKAAKQSYRLQTAQANAQYDLGIAEAGANHAWDVARVEQMRAAEAQNAVDQARYGSRVIAQAQENLAINTEALQDRFVTEEALRGTEAGMNLAYSQAKLADDTSNTVSQYLADINARAAQLDTVMDKKVNDVAELQASLAYDEKRDHLLYQIEQLEAVATDANTLATVGVRQGGGNTSKQLAKEGLRALGRKYGLMALKSQNNNARMALASRVMTDEIAGLSAQTAIQMGDMAQRIAYSTKRLGAEQGYKDAQFNNLIIPTFELGQRQYGRELRSLQLETKAAMDNATQDYRQQQFMDPIKPVAGLRPMSLGPTKVQGPSWGSIAGQALLGGVQGALSGASKKEDGTLLWT